MGYIAKHSGNYVKFLRGTPTAWQSIDVKDSDTLYFIAEDGADKGKLYLGSKLIANGDAATFLNDLEDILLSEGIAANSLLAYDSVEQKWVNKSLDELLSLVVDVMIGATAERNGTAGLVPPPLAGEQNLYLQGNGKWSSPTAGVEQEIIRIEQKVDTNSQTITDEISNLRGGRTGTIEDIAKDLVDSAVANIVAQAPESFDTLKEIADWITQHDTAINIAEIVVKVNNHEQTLNGPNGLVTKVNSLDDIISNPTYGLVVQMQSVTGNINELKGDVQDLGRDVINMNNDITNIKLLLQWQDLVEEDAV